MQEQFLQLLFRKRRRYRACPLNHFRRDLILYQGVLSSRGPHLTGSVAHHAVNHAGKTEANVPDMRRCRPGWHSAGVRQTKKSTIAGRVKSLPEFVRSA
jgi:hypothetical protein